MAAMQTRRGSNGDEERDPPPPMASGIGWSGWLCAFAVFVVALLFLTNF